MALRLMDFVSEKQVQEEKVLYKGGPRVEDRVVTNERPLFEILKENKDKKDAELNEKFKHRPPKALDDDETEFLESVEMHKRELERQQRKEDAEQVINFQAALASRTIIAQETRVQSHQQQEESAVKSKRPISARVLPISVRIKPVMKKMKSEPSANNVRLTELLVPEIAVIPESGIKDGAEAGQPSGILDSGSLGLAAYGDSDSDDE